MTAHLTEQIDVETHGAHEQVDVFAFLDAEFLGEGFGGLDVLEYAVPDNG